MCVARQFVLDLFFFKFSSHLFPWISLVAQLVKNPPEMQETRVRSLGWEDPLEERTTTHSSILACRILWTEKPVRRGRKESDTTEQLSLHFLFRLLQNIEQNFLCCAVGPCLL